MTKNTKRCVVALYVGVAIFLAVWLVEANASVHCDGFEVRVVEVEVPVDVLVCKAQARAVRTPGGNWRLRCVD